MQHLKEQFIDQIQKTACSLLKVLNSEKKILPVCFVPFRYISFCVLLELLKFDDNLFNET